MKHKLTKGIAVFAMALIALVSFGSHDAEAQFIQDSYFSNQGVNYNPYSSYNYFNDGGYYNQFPYWWGTQNISYPVTSPYYGFNSNPYGFTFNESGSYGGSYGNNDDRPDVDTQRVRDIDEDSAELNGEVDMNDFRNGIVFFVYGQDEDMIEDVERDYDSYEDVDDDEEDDDFEVERVDRDLDDRDDYSEDVNGLEEDERYYVVLCVEYEDEDGDERLECGDVEDFETDGDSSNDEEPDAETRSATDIEDDRAELRGEIDMNDFDDGLVFFVYGEDESDVEDVEDEDEYTDIDEQGDDLQKIVIDNNLSGQEDYNRTVFNLDDNTDIYFRICVEFENEDDDQELVCGQVREFETD